MPACTQLCKAPSEALCTSAETLGESLSLLNLFKGSISQAPGCICHCAALMQAVLKEQRPQDQPFSPGITGHVELHGRGACVAAA